MRSFKLKQEEKRAWTKIRGIWVLKTQNEKNQIPRDENIL
jgi:hypothetical protein